MQGLACPCPPPVCSCFLPFDSDGHFLIIIRSCPCEFLDMEERVTAMGYIQQVWGWKMCLGLFYCIEP